MNTQDIEKKIIPILKRQGVIKAAFFGSVARGNEKKRSDVDILVELKKNRSLLDLIQLQFEIEKKIGKKIDLLTYNSIHPLLKDIILNEQKIFYEKRS